MPETIEIIYLFVIAQPSLSVAGGWRESCFAESERTVAKEPSSQQQGEEGF